MILEVLSNSIYICRDRYRGTSEASRATNLALLPAKKDITAPRRGMAIISESAFEIIPAPPPWPS
jgi:hypothetical protein